MEDRLMREPYSWGSDVRNRADKLCRKSKVTGQARVRLQRFRVCRLPIERRIKISRHPLEVAGHLLHIDVGYDLIKGRAPRFPDRSRPVLACAAHQSVQ